MAQIAGHVADEIGSHAPFHGAPLPVAALEAVLVLPIARAVQMRADRPPATDRPPDLTEHVPTIAGTGEIAVERLGPQRVWKVALELRRAPSTVAPSPTAQTARRSSNRDLPIPGSPGEATARPRYEDRGCRPRPTFPRRVWRSALFNRVAGGRSLPRHEPCSQPHGHRRPRRRTHGAGARRRRPQLHRARGREREGRGHAARPRAACRRPRRRHAPERPAVRDGLLRRAADGRDRRADEPAAEGARGRALRRRLRSGARPRRPGRAAKRRRGRLRRGRARRGRHRGDPLHVRHDRQAEGRRAHARQPRAQRRRHARADLGRGRRT